MYGTEQPMTSPLKLACCGSSGGGKTTLTKLLSTRLDLPAITYSRPTAVAERLGYSRADRVPYAERQTFQWYGLFEQLYAERTIMRDHYVERFMSDRSVLDFTAYWLYEGGGQWGDDYMTLAQDHACRTYSLLIHIPPPTWDLEDNGIRHLHGVIEVDQILGELLHLSTLEDRTIHLQTPTPEERVEEVVAELKKRGLTS